MTRGIILASLMLLTGRQFQVPMRTGATTGTPSAPAYLGGCGVVGSAAATTASCTVTGVVAGETLVVFTNISGGGTSALTDAGTSTVTLLGCATGWTGTGSGTTCAYILTGAASGSHALTLTITGATGSTYPVIAANLASGGSVDGGTGSCTGATGCVFSNGSSSTLTGGTFTATANDLVFFFGELNAGVTLTGSASPISLTLAQNVAGNARSWYGTTSAGSAHAAATSSGSNAWTTATVAIH